MTDLKNKIFILDGAMGTMIQKYGLTEEDYHDGPFSHCAKELKGNNECLNLTRPEIIKSIHKEYIAAGADIIETNTFSANIVSQSEYGCGEFAFKMAYEGARIARQAADEVMELAASIGLERKVWIAGSIGPTSKSLSLSPDVSDPAFRPYSFDQMKEAYRQQADALVKGGADMLLIETCFDALNVKAALSAISDLYRDTTHAIPVMVSVSVGDRSGRTLTGQTLEAFYTAISHFPIISFGLNCSLGASELMPLIEDVDRWCRCAVSCYPNAGLPNEMGGYDQSPEDMAEQVWEMASRGLVNIVGGCCGTTPDHIKAISKALEGMAPRKISDCSERTLKVSGLEAVTIDRMKNNFTNVGERTNVAGSRKFARLISEGKYDEALQIAAKQIEDGAPVIDINMDDAMLDSTREMERFVRYISNDPSVSKAALMIDSSHWETILAGLKNAQGKCIVNSISLKEGPEAFVEKAKAIRELGAAMVVMAFDEQGQATSYDRKIEICERAYGLLTEEAGVSPEDIIFDVNILSIGTGIAEHARYGIDFIEAVRWIKTNLPGALTSGGVSNLSFAFRGNNTVREAMHSAFLYHAIKAGMDMAIVNPSMLQIYDEIEPELLKCVEDVIFDTDPQATERLLDYCQRQKEMADHVGHDEKHSGHDEKHSGHDERCNGHDERCSCHDEKHSGHDEKHSGHDERCSCHDERCSCHDERCSCHAHTGRHSRPDRESPENKLRTALVKGSSATLKTDLKEALEEYGTALDIIEGPLMAGMEAVGKMFGEGKMFLPQVVKSAKVMKDAVDILEPFMDGTSRDTGRPKVVIATVKGDVHDIGKNITGIVLTCNGFEVHDLGVMVDKETILDKAAEINADIIAVSGLITPSLYQMEEICREMTERGMNTPLFVGGATTSAIHTAVKLAPLYEHVYHGADASAAAVMAKKYMMDRKAFENEQHVQQKDLRLMYERPEPVISKPADTVSIQRNDYATTLLPDDMAAIEVSHEEVMQFFDWKMFYAIWGVKYGSVSPEAMELMQLKRDAEDELALGNFKISLSARYFHAYSDGKDLIMTYPERRRIPMLRQEDRDGISLCDFVMPESSGMASSCGVFTICVRSKDVHEEGCCCPACSNKYEDLVGKAVRMTLAEAASKWLDRKLLDFLHDDRIRIIKPAAGYSSCPDHTLKRDIMELLSGKFDLKIKLTESYAMTPEASICGFIFWHPQAKYHEIRRISREQYDDYAARRGMDEATARRFLGHLLK